MFGRLCHKRLGVRESGWGAKSHEYSEERLFVQTLIAIWAVGHISVVRKISIVERLSFALTSRRRRPLPHFFAGYQYFIHVGCS